MQQNILLMGGGIKFIPIHNGIYCNLIIYELTTT